MWFSRATRSSASCRVYSRWLPAQSHDPVECTVAGDARRRRRPMPTVGFYVHTASTR